MRIRHCRHCSVVYEYKSGRGLCSSCYRRHRELYPRCTSGQKPGCKAWNADADYEESLEPEPVAASRKFRLQRRKGDKGELITITGEWINVLRRRVERRQALHHAEDRWTV